MPNLLKLPTDLYLGEAAGVAVNSKGHIFVFTRSTQTRLLEFDGNGKFMREIGKDLYGFSFAHVVRIDKADNIWCVDEGSNMVIEFNPEGRVVESTKWIWTATSWARSANRASSPLSPDGCTRLRALLKTRCSSRNC